MGWGWDGLRGGAAGFCVPRRSLGTSLEWAIVEVFLRKTNGARRVAARRLGVQGDAARRAASRLGWVRLSEKDFDDGAVLQT